ncbi:MAG: type II secretion system protein [Anaerocolumna sp.]
MKKNRGFTLTELIIVMAIIAILILIATPKLLGYIEKTKEATELSDVRTLYTGAIGAIVFETAQSGISVDWTDPTFDYLELAIKESTNITDKMLLKTYATFSSVIYFANNNPDCWIVCYGIKGEVIDPNADIYIVAPSGTIYENGTTKIEY